MLNGAIPGSKIPKLPSFTKEGLGVVGQVDCSEKNHHPSIPSSVRRGTCGLFIRIIVDGAKPSSEFCELPSLLEEGLGLRPRRGVVEELGA